jgi:hypothetical protein
MINERDVKSLDIYLSQEFKTQESERIVKFLNDIKLNEIKDKTMGVSITELNGELTEVEPDPISERPFANDVDDELRTKNDFRKSKKKIKKLFITCLSLYTLITIGLIVTLIVKYYGIFLLSVIFMDLCILLYHMGSAIPILQSMDTLNEKKGYEHLINGINAFTPLLLIAYVSPISQLINEQIEGLYIMIQLHVFVFILFMISSHRFWKFKEIKLIKT